MRIILNQVDIEAAIEASILEQIKVPDDMRIDIDLKATRGEEGYSAYIDIVAHDAPTDGTDRSVDARVQPEPGTEGLNIAQKVMEARAQADAPVLPRRRGRPPGSKNKPKNQEVNTASNVTQNGLAGVPSQAVTEAVQEAQVEVVETPAAETITETVQASEEAENASKNVSENFSEEAVTNTNTIQPDTLLTPEVDRPEPMVETESNSEADFSGLTQAETETNEEAEEVEAVQAVETVQVEETEQEEETTSAPVAPTRSLFANLSRPTNVNPSVA